MLDDFKTWLQENEIGDFYFNVTMVGHFDKEAFMTSKVFRITRNDMFDELAFIPHLPAVDTIDAVFSNPDDELLFKLTW